MFSTGLNFHAGLEAVHGVTLKIMMRKIDKLHAAALPIIKMCARDRNDWQRHIDW